MGHDFPINAMLIDIVRVHSLPQLLEQYFPPPHVGIKYTRKQKLLQEFRNLPLTAYGLQWNPADFHSPVRSMTQFYYEYVLSRFGPRIEAHVKLYIGLFGFRRNAELRVFPIDGCTTRPTELQTIKMRLVVRLF